MLIKTILVVLGLATLWGCQSDSVELTEDPILRESLIYGDEASVYVVSPTYETTPVPSLDDAADDPAIWLHPTKPEQSLIIGTDKRSGLAVYDLRGEQRQFFPLGLPNNVDVRQSVSIAGWTGDLVAASNREGDQISFLSIDEQGLNSLGSVPASLPEPYGFCLGKLDEKVLAFVTYKTGETVAHHVQSVEGQINAPVVGSIRFQSQLEGCEMDDRAARIIIGEEAQGVWSTRLSWQDGQLIFDQAESIDSVSGESGVVADIEGVSIYHGETRYLVVSSQGNDSYAVYQADEGRFMGRFRVAANGTIDGTQETDGLTVSSAYLGSDFPSGLIVVQDGFNGANTPQNFKLISWKDVATALGL